MDELLVDSHVVVWMLADSPRLGTNARRAIVEAGAVWVSVVTPWELAAKRALGRLDMPDDLLHQLNGRGLRWLAVEPEDGMRAGALPRHHGDPFDRMLIAQATRAGVAVLTADDTFGAYDVTVIDASR